MGMFFICGIGFIVCSGLAALFAKGFTDVTMEIKNDVLRDFKANFQKHKTK